MIVMTVVELITHIKDENDEITVLRTFLTSKEQEALCKFRLLTKRQQTSVIARMDNFILDNCKPD